ncbi:hypothetical protein NDA13_000240 [Ustilago tritici]|nr:hypothetical protein NDA13_000240 [Ustilago tritici]
MSAPTTHQQRHSSLSAASFLASISAECSTSFASTNNSTANSAPSLPISAKVSLIDAQIEALESRIEQAVTSHADELRQSAASTRSVDHDLNQLWRSINQTSSRLVTVGPQLAPIASDYHDALAQSSKQGLLISVLSDLLAATKHLERLEKLQHQNHLSTLPAELPKTAELLQPFCSRSALQSMPAVLELMARLDRLSSKSRQVDSQPLSRSLETSIPSTASQAQARASLDNSRDDHKNPASTTTTGPTLSPALKVLESARDLIVSRGSEGGWKEVRIELDAPAPPPPPPPAAAPISEPSLRRSVDSNRSSLDIRAERILREDTAPGSTSLTRNSSSSSATNPRNRHKPKLGARVIRPQDQLGSGPFNPEEAALQEDGWDLNDQDDGEATQPTTAALPPHFNQPVHQTAASLAPASHNSSPSGSVAMQGSMTSSSSQPSDFAVQDAESQASGARSSNNVDAWGLGEEEVEPKADGWGLNDDVPQQRPPSPKRTKRASVLIRHAPAPTITSAATDAWELDEEVESEQPPASQQREETSAQAPVEPVIPSAASTTPIANGDAWDLEEDPVPELLPPSPKKPEEPGEAPATHPEVPAATATAIAGEARNLEDDKVQIKEPLSLHNQATHTAAPAEVIPPAAQQASTADQDGWVLQEDTEIDVDDDPWAAAEQSTEPTPAVQADTRMAPPPAEASKVEPSEALAAPFTRAVPAEAIHQPATAAQQTAPAEEASQQSHKAQESSSTALATTSAPQATSAFAVDMKAEEPKKEAWDFDDSSSASEADRAEIVAVTPLHKTESAASSAQQPSKVESAARSIPKETFAASTSQKPEPVASPPSSPGGWGEDFSDSESTGLPVSASRSSLAASRSLQPQSKAAVASSHTEVASAPEPATVLKERCTISQRSIDLFQLAESTMTSVISLLQSGHAGAEEAESLAGTMFKMFELHRALMPVAHGQVLGEVPSLAMQFFNDCEYLARKLTRLVSDRGDAIAAAWLSHDADSAKRWKTKDVAKLEQEAALTRALGQRWFEAQMTAQSKILLDTLMEADGFARTFDDNRFAICERCIKQVVQTLQQLDKAWRPVLVASRFHAAIGRLVDLVFQKVLHDLLDLEDIGESESEKLAALVKTLGSLESLFTMSDGQSGAPLWVPSWFKTSYLIEILTGSLVDIEFLAFEAGALVDYSRKELTGLIKALFADTPNRSKLLRRIEGASVDVLAR